MKKIYFLILSAIVVSFALSSKADENLQSSLSQYTWEHRVIITSVSSNTELSALENVLKTIWSDIDDRRLIVFAILRDTVYQLSPQAKESGLNIEVPQKLLNRRHTLLIGLDGGVKSVYDEFDSRQIFADIDAMPMRRARVKD